MQLWSCRVKLRSVKNQKLYSFLINTFVQTIGHSSQTFHCAVGSEKWFDVFFSFEYLTDTCRATQKNQYSNEKRDKNLMRKATSTVLSNKSFRWCGFNMRAFIVILPPNQRTTRMSLLNHPRYQCLMPGVSIMSKYFNLAFPVNAFTFTFALFRRIRLGGLHVLMSIIWFCLFVLSG